MTVSTIPVLILWRWYYFSVIIMFCLGLFVSEQVSLYLWFIFSSLFAYLKTIYLDRLDLYGDFFYIRICNMLDVFWDCYEDFYAIQRARQ